jgi:hypothetical protein
MKTFFIGISLPLLTRNPWTLQGMPLLVELEGQLHRVLSSGEDDRGSIQRKLFANPKAVGLRVGTRGTPNATSAWVKESSQSRGLRTRRATSGTSMRREHTMLIMEFGGLRANPFSV